MDGSPTKISEETGRAGRGTGTGTSTKIGGIVETVVTAEIVVTAEKDIEADKHLEDR
jgi:hypothetical protein